MKMKKIITVGLLSLTFGGVVSPIISNTDVYAANVVNDVGKTSVDIIEHYRTDYWAVSSTNGPFEFRGTLTVKLKNGRVYKYPISRNVKGFASGVVDFSSLIKEVKLTGFATFSNGIALSTPAVKVVNYSGSGAMSLNPKEETI